MINSFFLYFSRIRIQTVVTFAVLALFSGCHSEKSRINMLLNHFEQTKIDFPEDMMMIRVGKIQPFEKPGHIPVFIMYTGPEECSLCSVMNLTDREELFRMSEIDGSFLVMIIISPPIDEVETIIEQIITVKFRYPVYLDISAQFEEMNGIPHDQRFHSFLINHEYYPIFVGNPLNSDRDNQLFHSALATTKLFI